MMTSNFWILKAMIKILFQYSQYNFIKNLLIATLVAFSSNLYAACETNTTSLNDALSSIGEGTCENAVNGIISINGFGYGIDSQDDASVNINSGSIILDSDGYGIYSTGSNTSNHNRGSISANGIGIKSEGANSTNINSGSINTGADLGYGLNSTGQNSFNINSGVISTSGFHSYGINSSGAYTTTTNSGSILTSGLASMGIYSTGANADITNSSVISTSGLAAIAIRSLGNNAIINNSGSISTTGLTSLGLYSTGINSVISNSGSITTSGNSSSSGIRSDGANSTITNSGSVITTGSQGHGVVLSGNSQTLTNSGLIKATGANANAIRWNTGSSNGVVNLNRGSVIIGDMVAAGDHSNARLNINLGSGASYTYSVSSHVLVSDLNGRPMVAGSAHAAGVGNITTASQSLYERTSQITQSLDDRVRTYDAKQQPSQDFWVNTYYSDSGRGGQGLSGSNLSFNQYRSGITAGFNVKNSYTPTELIVNYEHGKLNIDEGNQGISSNSVMAGALFPDIKKLFTGTLSAKALVGYSDFSGDRKVLTNDVAFNGSRNVTANYQSSNLTIGSAWTKTLHQTDKMILDTLVGIDLNTQHINSYSESELFKWNGRTISQLQERVTLGMEIKPMVNPLTLYGRVGIERRDLLSGENQNYAINNTAVSYSDSNQRNTYATLNAGAYYPLTPTVKAYAQVKYYDSVKDIDSLSGSIGISGQF
jgi:hypothetical protein